MQKIIETLKKIENYFDWEKILLIWIALIILAIVLATLNITRYTVRAEYPDASQQEEYNQPNEEPTQPEDQPDQENPAYQYTGHTNNSETPTPQQTPPPMPTPTPAQPEQSPDPPTPPDPTPDPQPPPPNTEMIEAIDRIITEITETQTQNAQLINQQIEGQNQETNEVINALTQILNQLITMQDNETTNATQITTYLYSIIQALGTPGIYPQDNETPASPGKGILGIMDTINQQVITIIDQTFTLTETQTEQHDQLTYQINNLMGIIGGALILYLVICIWKCLGGYIQAFI